MNCLLRTVELVATLLISNVVAWGAEPPATLVVINAKVLTVDAKFSIAEALAIRDGLFVMVGKNADVKKLIGDQTQVIDAAGQTVVPGLIESHIHATGAARGEVTQPF